MTSSRPPLAVACAAPVTKASICEESCRSAAADAATLAASEVVLCACFAAGGTVRFAAACRLPVVLDPQTARRTSISACVDYICIYIYMYIHM